MLSRREMLKAVSGGAAVFALPPNRAIEESVLVWTGSHGRGWTWINFSDHSCWLVATDRDGPLPVLFDWQGYPRSRIVEYVMESFKNRWARFYTANESSRMCTADDLIRHGEPPRRSLQELFYVES